MLGYRFGCQKVSWLLAVAALSVAPCVAQSTRGLNFAPAVDYGSGGYEASSIAVADVNGDGHPDLLVANAYISISNTTIGVVSLLLGNGDGTFQPAVSYNSGGDGASSIAVADVNGDGKPDLLVANACFSISNCTNGGVSVLLGNGDGTFQGAVSYSSGGYSADAIAVADVNGDGHPDLLVGNCCNGISNRTNGVVSVLLGNGDGTFQPAVAYNSGGYIAHSVAVADVNEDGHPDLLVANECFSISNCTSGGVSVLLGNGDGTFQGAVSYNSGGYSAASIAVADVNGDGHSDLLVANNCVSGSNCNFPTSGGVSVLLGNGDGTFQAAVNYNSGGYFATSIAVADVNGDSHPDLLVTNDCVSTSSCASGSICVLLGNGDGTFQIAGSYTSGGGGANAIAVADVNRDGKPDVLVANECATGSNCSNGSVGVLINRSLPFVTITGSPRQPLNKSANGNFVANVTITNMGNVTITTVHVTVAGTTLGTGSLIFAPAPISNLAPGTSTVVTLMFPPSSVVQSATSAPLKVSGTYSVASPSLSGNWALGFRSVGLN